MICPSSKSLRGACYYFTYYKIKIIEKSKSPRAYKIVLFKTVLPLNKNKNGGKQPKRRHIHQMHPTFVNGEEETENE